LRGMKPIEGKSAAYVCENFACKAPVTEPKALGEMLQLGSKKISRRSGSE
jgi:hypothetical protein